MFCTNCGNQLPDGSKFCSRCGMRLEGLQPPQGVYRQPANTGYQAPYPQGGYGGGARGGYAEIDNRQPPSSKYAWLIGGEMLIAAILAIPIALITYGNYEASEKFAYVIGFLKLIVLWLDSKEVKRSGYKVSALWYIIGAFCSGPFLFVRAKKTDKNYKYFFFWIVTTVLVFVVLGAVINML